MGLLELRELPGLALVGPPLDVAGGQQLLLQVVHWQAEDGGDVRDALPQALERLDLEAGLLLPGLLDVVLEAAVVPLRRHGVYDRPQILEFLDALGVGLTRQVEGVLEVELGDDLRAIAPSPRLQ